MENNTPSAPVQSEQAPIESKESDTSVENTEELVASEKEDASAESPKKEGDLKEAVKQAEKSLKKKLKLKVDGKEIEEEIDFGDEAYLTKQIQLAKAAQKRMAEYAELEKNVKSFIDELKKNPRKVLKDSSLGIDEKELARQIIEEEIANSQKTPEQIEREKLENELKSMKEEREREKEELRAREFERLQAQEYERYDTLITSALEKSDLPKSEYVVKKMADYMLLGLSNGFDVDPQDVLPLVRSEIQDEIKQMFQVMPDDVIESIIGKDTLNRVRKKNLAKAKEKPPVPINKSVQDTGAKASGSKEKAEKKTFKDFFGI